MNVVHILFIRIYCGIVLAVLLISSKIDFTPGFAMTTLSNINLAVFLIYLQIGCSLIGSLGALYNGVLLINLAISLFVLVAIESNSQRLFRAYAFLLFSSFLLDVAWNISSDKYGLFFVFSVKLTLAMQIVGFTVRLSSSLLWIHIYRLGVPYIDSTATREADFDLSSSFLSPTTTAPVGRQCSDSDVVLGGSIYDPDYYLSLFEDGQDSRCLRQSWASFEHTKTAVKGVLTQENQKKNVNKSSLLKDRQHFTPSLGDRSAFHQEDQTSRSFLHPSESRGLHYGCPKHKFEKKTLTSEVSKELPSSNPTPSLLTSESLETEIRPLMGKPLASNVNRTPTPSVSESLKTEPQPHAGKIPPSDTPVTPSESDSPKTEVPHPPGEASSKSDVNVPTTAPQPNLSTFGLKLEPSASSVLTTGLSTGFAPVNQPSLNHSGSTASKVALNSKPQQPSSHNVPFGAPILTSDSVSGKNESLDVAVTEEVEMEEAAPEASCTNELNLGNPGGFGIGSTPIPNAPRANPFGSPFCSTGSNVASSSLTMTVPSGELFRPASFNFQSPHPSQKPPPTNMGAFSGGFGTGAVAQAPAQSQFGQPAHIGSGQQALGSVLGTFGQSTQFGTSLPGSGFASTGGFGGGLATSSSTGGFASAATAGGFAGVASTGGGFAAWASSGAGFGGVAAGGGFGGVASGGSGIIGSGQQALGSVLGTFGQSRQFGTGLPGSGFASTGGFGGGLATSSSTGGFASAATAGGFAGVASTGGGFAALASSGAGFGGVAAGGGFGSVASGGGFGGVASGGSGIAGVASGGGGFAAAASSAGGFAAAPPSGSGFGASGSGFGAFGSQQGTGGFSGFPGNAGGSQQGIGGFSAFSGNPAGTGKPADLFTQMRK
ncbi:hypothetical protein POTOM_014763 [Populus tomentosa]|uniref:Uncharacterized protein n=1 Tax=Populus tomentosa TaxID=118781 RepID=A0A8X8ACH9_POPTO|nr:hypothetical protein POTOM_014763 [Populus tomentosa]